MTTRDRSRSQGVKARLGGQRRLIGLAIFAMLGALQILPASQVFLESGAIPLPLAIGVTNFAIIPFLLIVADIVLERRVTLFKRMTVTAAVAAVGGAIVGALLWTGVVPRISRSPPSLPPPFTLGSGIVMGVLLAVFVVGVWSLVVLLPSLSEQERIRSLELANLQLEAAELRAESELARLRGQLEPHFLLNTLNLIAGLVGMDAEKARRTLVNLGALLRDTIAEHREVHTLEEELDWLQRYCEILEVRHGPMLRIEWNIADAPRDALLPRHILQPLVENAVIHGALRSREQGFVRISIGLGVGERSKIICEIEDNGPGPKGPPRPGAIGVENVRRRLEVTEPGSVFSLSITDNGARARIEMPYRTEVKPEAK